tara:strand:+ start:2126 stop:2368 length:243 start_codon:yes stop_codon:yes gene_type:complete
MNTLIEKLKAKEVKTWNEYKNIQSCFPIEKRTEKQEYLIRESRATWYAWSKAHVMALESKQKQIETQIKIYNNRFLNKQT